MTDFDISITRVRVKRLIRNLYRIKQALLYGTTPPTDEDVELYYSLRECLFKDFGIESIRSPEEGDEVFVTMTNGVKLFYCEDELYNPSTWADYDEEDEPLDEEF